MVINANGLLTVLSTGRKCVLVRFFGFGGQYIRLACKLLGAGVGFCGINPCLKAHG